MVDPTPLVSARKLAARLGVERLHAKLEGANPSGFHKGRSAAAMVAEAVLERHAAITVGTCGSTGLAVARLAARSGLACTVFVPERYRGAPIQAMRAHGATVVRPAGSYEDAVAASVAHALTSGAYDANPTGPGGQASLKAYEAIADEILAQLGRMPDTVWVPAGNGTTVAGVARGFLRLAAGGAPPRVCAAGSFGNTAVVESILAGRVLELKAADLRETEANEPLLNWRSAHAAEALEAVRATGGTAYAATDAELFEAVDLLRLDAIAATPAAASALAALRASRPPGSVHVLVLTA